MNSGGRIGRERDSKAFTGLVKGNLSVLSPGPSQLAFSISQRVSFVVSSSLQSELFLLPHGFDFIQTTDLARAARTLSRKLNRFRADA